MKYIIEILDEGTDEDGDVIYKVDKSKTIEFNSNSLTASKNRFDIDKPNIGANKKIRLVEYYNDDPDELHKPCEVLFE